MQRGRKQAAERSDPSPLKQARVQWVAGCSVVQAEGAGEGQWQCHHWCRGSGVVVAWHALHQVGEVARSVCAREKRAAGSAAAKGAQCAVRVRAQVRKRKCSGDRRRSIDWEGGRETLDARESLQDHHPKGWAGQPLLFSSNGSLHRDVVGARRQPEPFVACSFNNIIRLSKHMNTGGTLERCSSRFSTTHTRPNMLAQVVRPALYYVSSCGIVLAVRTV